VNQLKYKKRAIHRC